jgi:SagB-type dehydrogenase family enzyme
MSVAATQSESADLAIRRARICRGLAIVKQDDGLLFEGGLRRLRLTGKAAASLMPRLLPLLDGQRTADEVCSELNISPAHLDQVIDRLREHGLLEMVPTSAKPMGSPRHVATYLSRIASATGGHLCAEDLQAALSETVILLVAPSRFASKTASDLAEVGVAQVVMRLSAADVSAADISAVASATHACVAVFDDDGEDLLAVSATFHNPGLPVLRFTVAENYFEVGPLFYGNHTGCAECFRRAHGNMAWSADQDTPGMTAVAAELAASLLTAELLAATVQLTMPALPGRMARYSLPGCTLTAYDLVPDCGCEICGPGTPAAGAATYVEAYERQMALPPPALMWGTAALDSSQVAALQTEREIATSAPRRKLPDCSVTHSSGLYGVITESSLARLLRGTAGTQPDARRAPGDGLKRPRWAPTGGNLASVEIYVAAGVPRFGLPGSIFRYDDLGHQLVPISRDVVPLARLLRRTDLTVAGDDLVLVMVGAVGRLSRKYDAFGLRLAHLDAGCASLQLALLAADCGLSVSFASRWDGGDLEYLLELHQGLEIVTAVASLSHPSQKNGEIR